MAHIEGYKIIVLGGKYIASPKKKSKSLMPLIIQMAAVVTSIYPLNSPYHKAPRRRPNVNLIEEYELIQLKKSKFSKCDRDWIEYQFHKNFIKVD